MLNKIWSTGTGKTEDCSLEAWWRHQMETFSALLALYAHKGQWRGALIFFICAGINDRVNNREVGDLRRHRGHCDVNVMGQYHHVIIWWNYGTWKSILFHFFQNAIGVINNILIQINKTLHWRYIGINIMTLTLITYWCNHICQWAIIMQLGI